MAPQQVRAPCADGAGHHRNAIQQIECALFEILAGDVFERLPASEPAIAVHHFHVAGDGADSWIGEMADEQRDRFGIHDRVRINRDDDFAGGFRETMIQRGGLAVIGLQAAGGRGDRGRNFRGPVRQCDPSSRRQSPESQVRDTPMPARSGSYRESRPLRCKPGSGQ